MALPSASEIEAACLLAWPALEEQHDGAWIARFARGYSKRANSIQSHDAGDVANASARIDALAEGFTARGLRPTYRVTPLTGDAVVETLEAKGWAPFEPSLVLAMELSKRLRAVGALTKLFEATDAEWVAAQSGMAGTDAETVETLSAILGKIGVPARGVIAYDEAFQPVGAALAVNANGIAIFLNVVVAPEARGQGFGRAVMNSALNWTSQSGATQAAIQVLAENATALGLYRSLGFADVYPYEYRRAPL